LLPTSDGQVNLDGELLTGRTIRRNLDAGIGYVPEDRTEDGIVAEFTVANNLILDLYDRPPFSNRGAIRPGVVAENADEQVERFDVRTTSTEALTGSLSGGNQQKVVLARELTRDLKVLIASQPTRGLD